MSSRHFPFALLGLACLACSKEEEPYSRAADFTYTGTLKNGSSVTFSNASADARSYSWDFKDSTAVSTVAQPVHAFSKAGTYPVTLTVESPGGPRSHVEQLVIADTLDSHFAAVVGDYRLTKKYTRVVYPLPLASTTACDVALMATRDGYLLVMDGNTVRAQSMRPLKDSPGYRRFYYTNGARSRVSTTFKIGTDSVIVSYYFNDDETIYWGKRR